MEWRVVPTANRYLVSEVGEVYRAERVYRRGPGPVKASLTTDGYLRVALSEDSGRYVHRSVHSVVAEAFIGPRPSGAVICHFDGNRRNNHYSNLRYDTPQANVHDAMRHGTHTKGERTSSAKLSEQDVARIKQILLATTRHMSDIAAEFGVKPSVISRICRFEGWRHVAPCMDLRGWRPEGCSTVAFTRPPNSGQFRRCAKSPNVCVGRDLSAGRSANG